MDEDPLGMYLDRIHDFFAWKHASASDSASSHDCSSQGMFLRDLRALALSNNDRNAGVINWYSLQSSEMRQQLFDLQPIFSESSTDDDYDKPLRDEYFEGGNTSFKLCLAAVALQTYVAQHVTYGTESHMEKAFFQYSYETLLDVHLLQRQIQLDLLEKLIVMDPATEQKIDSQYIENKCFTNSSAAHKFMLSVADIQRVVNVADDLPDGPVWNRIWAAMARHWFETHGCKLSRNLGRPALCGPLQCPTFGRPSSQPCAINSGHAAHGWRARQGNRLPVCRHAGQGRVCAGHASWLLCEGRVRAGHASRLLCQEGGGGAGDAG